MQKKELNQSSRNKTTIGENFKKWLVILVGSVTWSLTMVKSGFLYDFGLGFWGANGHDGIWHIALAESLAKSTLSNPVFSGFNIQNYHIGFDLILSIMARITSIPLVTIYFQIIPPVLAVLVGYATYRFVFEWSKSENGAFWATFFTYFGGSFGFLLGKGESAFWSQQSISSLINPSYALSLILILSGLTMLLRFEKERSKSALIWAVFFLGILSGIKIYASLLILFGLGVVSVYKFLKNRDISFGLILILVFILSAAIYLPLNKNSQNIIIWQPLWFLETMMGTSDRIGWNRFYSAMTTYKSGHLFIKAFFAYNLAFLIFIVGNMGTRFLCGFSIFKWLYNFKNIKWTELLLCSAISIGVVVPMLFVQKGTPWNTIQFFYYSLFFSGITAGVAFSEMLAGVKKVVGKKVLLTILVFFTVPTTIYSLKDVYIPSRPPAMLSKEEISALSFLSKQPQGIVLTYPFDENKSKKAESNPPRPLYLYVSTAYVSAFSGHQTFLEDEVNLDITGYDWRDRRERVLYWYQESDQLKAKNFLKDNNIKYIYWVNKQRALLGEGQLGIVNIFENPQVTIYRVD